MKLEKEDFVVDLMSLYTMVLKIGPHVSSISLIWKLLEMQILRSYTNLHQKLCRWLPEIYSLKQTLQVTIMVTKAWEVPLNYDSELNSLEEVLVAVL